ncbi:MAG: Fur family transcriptional regulator [Acidimicrobiales bacterium]
MATLEDAIPQQIVPPDAQERIEEVLDLVREHGGRVTTSRRNLLRCLFDNTTHRTAEELAAEVQKLTPDVHLSTIYRNLDELESLGVVVHAHLGHGPATYHLASDSHGHLVCEQCGATFEAPEELFDELVAAAQRTLRFEVDVRHFSVLGRCGDCAVPDVSHEHR